MTRAALRLAILAAATVLAGGSSCGISQTTVMPQHPTARDMNEEKANCYLRCRDSYEECRALCPRGAADAERCMSNCETQRFACDEAC